MLLKWSVKYRKQILMMVWSVMVMVWWYVMPEVCSAWTKRRTAPSEDRTHDFQIMRLALCRLSYRSSWYVGILFLFWPFHLMTVGVPTNRRKGTFHDMWRTDNSLNSVANSPVRLSLTNAFFGCREWSTMGARKSLPFHYFRAFPPCLPMLHNNIDDDHDRGHAGEQDRDSDR